MLGVSPLAVAKILDYHNVNLPAGYVRTSARDLRLDTSGSFETLDNIRDAVIDVSRVTGQPLRVGDVFSVTRGLRDPPRSKLITDGDPSVGLDLRMAPGYSVVTMGEEVNAVVTAFRRELPPAVALTLLHDQPREVDSFIGDFMSNLLQGLLIVILVMLVSMGLRATFLVAVSLPLSIIATLALLPSFGVMLEQVSIASFIIALGMLVDNAIIITDNIDRRLQAGETPREAAVNGAHELWRPVLAGTLGTVAAFGPLILMRDEMGAYIRALPVVVSLSMLCSFVLAMTLTPMLGAAVLRARPGAGGAPSAPRVIERAYASLLRWGMRLRFVVLALSLLALWGSIKLVPVIGLSFFPKVDRDQFTVDIWMPEGSGIERTEETVRQVAAILGEHEEVEHWIAYVGEGGPRFYITVMPQFNTLNYARFMVSTRDKDETRALVSRLRTRFRQEISGAWVKPDNILLGKPVEAPIAIKIQGDDLGSMREISAQVQAILRDTPGADFVRDNQGQDVASLRVVIDSEVASMSGISNTEVAATLLTAQEGLPVTDFREGEERVPIILRAEAASRGFAVLDELRVPSQATGEKVPLAAFATIEPRWAPGVVHRLNNARTVSVLAETTSDRVLASEILKEAWPRIQALDLPPGMSVSSEGEQKEREAAFGDLAVIFVVIISALLLMLVIQFGALGPALTILFSVPLALVGAVLGLWASGNSFGFMAFLGVVSLAGMVIKNAVVWVEFVDRALEEGADLSQAIVDAGVKRARPILLTAATTIGGLLPLAVYGGVLWEGMAWAMIAGLSLATVLTLVIVPVFYYMVLRRRHEPPRGGARRAPAKVSSAIFLAVAFAGLSLGFPGTARAEHPLESYMRQAEIHAVQNRAAALAVSKASLERREAYSSFLPIPMLEARATRLDKPMALSIDTSAMDLPIPLDFPPMTLADSSVYQVRGRLTLPLWVGGKRFAYLDATGHGLDAQRAVREATTRGVAFGVAARYVQLLEARAMVRIWEERLASDQELLAVARKKEAAGLGVPFDVSYAETISADSERRLEEARSAVGLGRHRLNDLCGRALDEEILLQELSYDPAYEPSGPELLEGLKMRPELAARDAQVAALEDSARGVGGDLYPTVAFVGEAGYKHGDLGYLDGDRYWMATLALRWNALGDAGAWLRRDKARLSVEQARVDGLAERRALELELSEARRQYEDVRRVFAVAERAVRTAEAGQKNARLAWEQGLLPMTTMIEASKALAEARQHLSRARYGRVLAELRLRYVAGSSLLPEGEGK